MRQTDRGLMDDGIAAAKAAASGAKEQGKIAAAALEAAAAAATASDLRKQGAAVAATAATAVTENIALAAGKLEEITAEQVAGVKKMAQGAVVNVSERIIHDAIAKIVAPKVSDALGADPDMPDAVINVISGTVRIVCRELEVEIVTGIHQNVLGTSNEVKNRMEVDAYACCMSNPFSTGWESYIPMPLWWLRAKILYSLLPHDRSIWSNLRNPWWLFFSVLKVFPVFYVSMSFWVLLFIIRNKKDKFQLVSFIVELKQAHFVSYGVVASIISNLNFLHCVVVNADAADITLVNPQNCEHAGTKESFQATSALFALQMIVTWILVGLISQADRMGDRRQLDAVAKFEAADADNSGFLGFAEFCALSAHAKHSVQELRQLFDSLDVSGDGKISTAEFRKFQGLHGADIFKDRGPEASKDGHSGGGEGKPKNYESYLWWWIMYDAICCLVVVGLISYSAVVSKAFTNDLDAVPAIFQLTIWWTRSFYGWLCLPWMLLQGFLYPLLMHLPKTAYNAQGKVCPIATAQERKRSRDRRMLASGDRDNDGLLDYDEFALLYDNVQRSEDQLRAIFARLDVDGNGKIDKEEFVKFQRLHDDARKQKRKDEEAQRHTENDKGPVTVSIET